MYRRVIAVDEFYDSLDALDKTTEIVEMGQALLLSIALHPENGAPLPARPELLLLRVTGHERCPSLRVIYKMTDEKVYLLHINAYDRMDD